MPDDQQLLSSSEVCAVLQISRSTLVRWIAAGKITAVQKLPGQSGVYLFDPAEIARFVIARARAG